MGRNYILQEISFQRKPFFLKKCTNEINVQQLLTSQISLHRVSRQKKFTLEREQAFLAIRFACAIHTTEQRPLFLLPHPGSVLRKEETPAEIRPISFPSKTNLSCKMHLIRIKQECLISSNNYYLVSKGGAFTHTSSPPPNYIVLNLLATYLVAIYLNRKSYCNNKNIKSEYSQNPTTQYRDTNQTFHYCYCKRFVVKISSDNARVCISVYYSKITLSAC